MPSRSEIIRAKRKAIGGKRPRCKKGTSCSAACINRNKKCLVNAPTPVADSIPRAIRAIQTRRERLGPREKRQALQRRRDYIRGKAVESAELKKQRRAFIVRRNLVLRGLRGALIQGTPSKIGEMEDKLKAMEAEAIKLKVPPVAKVFTSEVRDKVSRVEKKMADIKSKMTRYAQVGARGSYDKLERQYLRLKEGLFRYAGLRSNLSKGEVWQNSRSVRNNSRNAKLLSVYNKLQAEAKKAARDNDIQKYRAIEKSLLKVSDRIQKENDIKGRAEALVKGVLWKDVKVPQVLEKLHTGMKDALDAGDLNSFLRLEEKFFNVREKYLKSGGNYYRRSNNLNSLSGFSAGHVVRGGTLTDHLEKLRLGALRAAKLKERREYNTLEEKLLKLDPKEVKGRIWRDQVKSRAKDFIDRTRVGMELAAKDKKRKEYNKLERVLMKLDPSIKKGEIWRNTLTRAYLPKLNSLLAEAAESGNRKKYDKLERVLFKINPYVNSDKDKGKIWRETRVGGALDKLMVDIEKAVKDGDRERYDKLEDRFFRIKAKAPKAPAIRDTDLNYVMSKGQLWREIERSIPLQGLESSLDRGKREGVSNIKIRGGVDSYQVTSKVLGNDLKVFVTPNDSTSFTVNGSYTAGVKDLPRREQIAIIREVSRQYDEIFKSMEVGTVFMVTAAEGDDRKEMRERGYTGRGFSEPDDDGRMYGKVGRGGRIIPIDYDEYDYVRSGPHWDDEDED